MSALLAALGIVNLALMCTIVYAWRHRVEGVHWSVRLFFGAAGFGIAMCLFSISARS